MPFTINRVRAVAANDAGFSDLVAVLPDGADRCLCCRRPSHDSLAMILVADESDDDPRALFGQLSYPGTPLSRAPKSGIPVGYYPV